MDLIQESIDRFEAAESIEQLVNAGVDVFSINYIDTVHKRCWPAFSKRLVNLQNKPELNVVVFDVSAVHFAAWAKREDEGHIDGVAGALNRIESIKDNLSHDVVFFAADSLEVTRRASYDGYKCSRDEKEEGFAESVSRLKGKLGHVIEAEGWEADDCMASIAFRAKLRKQACTLVTDDKDLWQTLGHGVTMYSPRKHEIQSEDWLRAKHSITPKQVVDWLCLVGKDDVPSCKGVAEKTASGLLKKYSNFLNIVDDAENLTKAKRESVLAFRDDYWLARELHTLKRNLEFNW